jgi:hypothetical protein
VRAAGEGGRRKVVEELATVPFHRTHQYIYFQRHRCCAELLQRQKLSSAGCLLPAERRPSV